MNLFKKVEFFMNLAWSLPLRLSQVHESRLRREKVFCRTMRFRFSLQHIKLSPTTASVMNLYRLCVHSIWHLLDLSPSLQVNLCFVREN